MSQQNKPPIEVTLNESTGTWEVLQASKRQFRPWQRLWFVSGIIYLLLLAGSYYVLLPNQEGIERRRVFSVTEEVKRYDGMAFAGESPRQLFEIASSQGYAAWIASVRSKYRIGTEGNTGFSRVEKEYRDAISDLPLKRSLGVIICILAWLIPMSAFYAFGAGVDWIKRGIRGIKGR